MASCQIHVAQEDRVEDGDGSVEGDGGELVSQSLDVSGQPRPHFPDHPDGQVQLLSNTERWGPIKPAPVSGARG